MSEPYAPAAARPRGQLSILKLLAAGGVARLLVLPVTGLANLVIARLITDAVGVGQFGAVMLIATLSQMLTFADLGASAAVANATAQLDGSPERTDQFRRTLRTALRVMALAATALALIAVVVAVVFDWSAVLGIRAGGENGALSANLATVIALAAFAISLLFALGEPLQRGSGRLHRAVLLVGISAPAALVITAVLRAVDAPLFAYALAIPVGAAFGLFCCAVGAMVSMRSLLRGILGEVLHPRRFPGTRIFATAAPAFVITIGLPLALQTDRLIIAHRSTAEALSTYSYAVQLYLPIWSVISVAALSLWPVFGSGSSRTGLRRGWLTAVGVLTALGLLFGLAYLVLAPVIIGWTSDGSAHPPLSLLLSFAFLLLVQAAHVGSGVMLIAPHQLRFQAICVTALVVTNLPLSWVLTPPLGAAGPVLASAITVTGCQLIPGFLAAWRASQTSDSGSRSL